MAERPNYRKYDPQEVANIVLDDFLKVDKEMLYGWYAAGGQAIALKINLDGTLPITT